MRSLPPGWRVVDMAPDKIDKHLKEVAKISRELAEVPRIKQAPVTHFNGKLIADLTSGELEAFHFSQQPESTRAAILRQKERKQEDDNDYLLRPIPDSYLANPNAKTLDELTAKRNIDPDEYDRERGLKFGRNQLGQSTKGSVDADKRDRGIEAFTYSPPANPSDEDIRRLKKLEPMQAVMAEPAGPRPERKKRPWWKFWGDDLSGIPMSEWTDEEFKKYWGRDRDTN